MVNTAALVGLGVIVAVPTVAVAYEYNQYQALVAANGGPYASATGSTGFFAWLTGGMPKTWGSAPTGTSYNWNGTSCVLASGTSGTYSTLAACMAAHPPSATAPSLSVSPTSISYAGTPPSAVYSPASVSLTGSGYYDLGNVQILDENGNVVGLYEAGSGGALSASLAIGSYQPTAGTGYLQAVDVATGEKSVPVPVTYANSTVPPQINPDFVTTLNGDTVSLDITWSSSVSISSIKVSWGDGTVQSYSIPTPSHTYSSGGTYVITVTLVDTLGTTASASLAVNIITAAPQISVSPTSVGAGGSVTISGSGFTPSGVATVFVWFQTTETLVFNINISASGSITQAVPTEAVITGIYSCYVLDNTSGLTSNTVEFSGIGVA